MTIVWETLIADAKSLRHSLHQHPELRWQETQTARTIREQLSSLEIDWRVCADTGTVATLARKAQGPHIALRADIDALPIIETTNAPWTSKHEGCMHACGHDGHTAVMVGAAQWLKQHEDQLPGPVSLLFQPAEEGGFGAKRMIEEGVLKGVDFIFGWHNWPAIPFGKAVCPDGPVMAANGLFTINIEGKGGHASQPEQCRDPVLAAAAITTNLQQIVSRRLPPQKACVIAITSIDAKSAATVTPQKVELAGSIRITDDEVQKTVIDLIEQITRDIASAYGVTAKTKITPCYGATINHPVEAQTFRHALQAELGEDWCSTKTLVPIMASEDFSYFLNEIPGAYALIGSADGDRYNISCHSPDYDFNDELLPIVIRLYARLAGAPLP